jgi:hypothetical protein
VTGVGKRGFAPHLGTLIFDKKSEVHNAEMLGREAGGNGQFATLGSAVLSHDTHL